MKMERFASWLVAAAVAVAMPIRAYAQQANNASDTSSQPPATTLEDIVVTAERRSERLQDVPLSVTAITSENLEQAAIVDTRDLTVLTPGLRVEAIGPYVQPSIRGITTQLTNNQEPNVATYVDGVYQATTVGSIYSLSDVDQIEVLKGPQGTLFGRNATGGAILINTLSPDLDAVKAKLSAALSSFDTRTFSGFTSVPLIKDYLAASLTGYYEQMDGYKDNLAANGSHYQANEANWLLRGKLRFVPWEGADFVLTGMTTHDNDNDILKFTSLDGNALGKAFLAPGQPLATGPRDFAFNTNPTVQMEQHSVSLRGSMEAGPGTLTATSAYTYNASYLLTDLDNTLAPIGYITVDQKTKVFTQELVYTTNQLGPMHGTAGAFFFHSVNSAEPVAVRPLFSQWWQVNDASYAGFGELTYDITQALSLTAGVRYSDEVAKEYFTNRLLGANPAFPGYIPFRNSNNWHSTTPRASLLYKFTGSTNAYFTYSDGFKSGVFNPNGLQIAPVAPEKVQSYELGVKSDLTSSLRVDGAVFHYRYSDLQVSALQGVTVVVENAAQAKITGAELTVDWQATDAFRLNLGETYLHARYDSFSEANICLPLLTGGNNCNAVTNASGNTMVRAPQLSGNVTGTYSWSTGFGNIDLSATFFHSSRVFYEVADRISQGAYALLNATASWRPHDSNFELKVWGRNLTDETYIESTTITQGGDEVIYAPPRAIGGEISYRF